ncbi:MAG: RNA-binding protein [Hahellaceae bacterium]|nr:RNA-binding protein [Hahellaceae bacterium]
MTNIYVGNLSYQVTEDDLRGAFTAFGQVSRVNVVKDRETGRSKGFGFVEMDNADEAKNAIEKLNNTDLKGRQMNVNEARPREDKPRPRGGDGGNRRPFR